MTRLETNIAVVPGLITMQAIALQDGTTIVFQGDPPALVYAVVLRLEEGVKILSYHTTEADAEARMVAEIDAKAGATLQ